MLLQTLGFWHLKVKDYVVSSPGQTNFIASFASEKVLAID